MANINEDIDDLGPIGIIREAFKILRTYRKVFFLIQLAFMLDVVTVGTVCQYLLFRLDISPPPGQAHNLHVRIAAESDPSLIIKLVTMFVHLAVFTFVYNAALSLSLSATLHSVALHYAGQAVSFVDVIRASVPRLWMRLAVTSSYSILIENVIVLVQAVGALLLVQSDISMAWVLALSQVVSLSSTVLDFGISLIFTVATGVSVFEEDYGWAAVRKGLKLLKGKVKVAILLRLCLMLPGLVSLIFAFGFDYEIRQADFGTWNYLIRTVTGAAYFVWMSFTLQLSTLCYGVQYASFKASHKSVSITDSIRAEKVKYGSVGNGADEPLLGGQETDSTV